MPEIALWELLVLAGATLVVSTAVGIVAFGFAMAMTPIMLIFLEPRLVVELNVILTVLLFGVISAPVRRNVKLPTLPVMLLGGAVGIPFGVLITKSVSDSALSLMLVSVVIATTLMALLNRYRYFRREALAGFFVGGAFTVVNAALALGGPLMALFALNQRWDRDTARAMISTFFLVTGLAIVATHAATGLLGLDELRVAALLAPSLLLGSVAASKLAPRVNEALFRRLVIATLLTLSVGVLGGQLSGLL